MAKPVLSHFICQQHFTLPISKTQTPPSSRELFLTFTPTYPAAYLVSPVNISKAHQTELMLPPKPSNCNVLYFNEWLDNPVRPREIFLYPQVPLGWSNIQIDTR